VSIQGSDSTGNGSSGKPWRTIQYALDHAQAYGNSTIRINLAAGFYKENILIDHNVIIRGAGSSLTVTSSSNPLIPKQSVSVIEHQSPANVPWYENKTVYANDAGEVRLENLNIFGGMVVAEKSDFSLDHVVVYGVSGYNPDYGVFGVRIQYSSFSINNSYIKTGTNMFADLGLDIIASSGFVNNSYFGNGFDHVINIVNFPPWLPSPSDYNVYQLPVPNQIYITKSIVEGSSVYWADGIRISSPVNIVVQDTKITRAAGGQPANAGPSHQYPYAGIDVNTGMVVSDVNDMRRVEILNTQTSGFDVGIGVRFNTLELKVQGSSIQGLTYGVQSFIHSPSGTTDPTVDFGGGPLGSKGKNNFSNQPKYAYNHNNAPYPVFACYNTWNVASYQIDSLRIFDKLDVPTLGRVTWDCTATLDSSQQGLTVVTPSITPIFKRLVAIPTSNVSCRAANSSDSAIVDFLEADGFYKPVGRGPDNQWLLFQAPSTGKDCWAFAETLRILWGIDFVLPTDLPNAVLPFVPYPFVPTETPTREPVERDTPEPTPCQNRVC
jgi:hypothetical protein